MTTPLSLIARKAELLGLRDALDAGGAALLFYPNTPTALPDDTTTEVLIGAINLAVPSGAIGQSGTLATLTLTTPQVAPAANTGLIGWARLVDGAGNGFLNLLAGLPGSGAPVIVNTLQVYAGGEIQLLSCVIAK